MMLSGLPDPSFLELLDWLEGRLDEAAASAVAGRMAVAGPDAVAALDWITSFLVLANSEQLETPPASLHERLVRLYDSRSSSAPDATAPDGMMLGELVFDSRYAGLVGVRGSVESPVEDFQLAFRSGPIDIVLDVSSDGSSYRFEGQVLEVGSGAISWTVVVEAAGAFVGFAHTDDLGTFGLDSVPGQASWLVASCDRMAVTIDLSVLRLSSER